MSGEKSEAVEAKRTHQVRTINKIAVIFLVITVILAVAAFPNVGCSLNQDQIAAAKAERVTVQTAMDTMMAKNQMTTVTPVTEATNNMSSFPPNSPLYPNYLRTATTQGTYSCDATGLITQEDYDY